MISAELNIWDLRRLDEWRAVLAGVRFSGSWNPGYLAGTLRKPFGLADLLGAVRGALPAPAGA